MTPPFLAALGAQAADLPPILAALHGGTPDLWEGRVNVARKDGWLGAAACRVAGFPPQMHEARFSLTLKMSERREHWRRDFGGHTTASVLQAKGGGLRERLGLVTLILRPDWTGAHLTTHVTGARILGILPLPRRIVPRSDVRIWQDAQGRYAFDIAGHVPGLGEVIRYAGWLLPKSPGDQGTTM